MEVLFQDILTHFNDCCYAIPIDKIDGICVDVFLSTVMCKQGDLETKEVKISIFDTWKHKRMWWRYCGNPTQLQEALTALETLKYDKLNDIFPSTVSTPLNRISREILKHIPKCDNVEYSIQDCAICLELTIEKTSCNHSLCRQCESKLTEKKCPMCRTSYSHVGHDMEDDDDF